MKKNQERRLHRKNAKIAKEGGTLMTLNRPIKPDTTVRPHFFFLTADLFSRFLLLLTPDRWSLTCSITCPETMRSLRPNGSHEYVNRLFPTLPFSTIVLCLPRIPQNFPLSLSETNRKCPRWAEFNSGTQPPATPTATASGSAGSPPPLTPSLSNSLGLGQISSLHVPSPLATTPPVVAALDDVPTAPKIKLTLKR